MRTQLGFTLIELLVSLAIIAAISSLVLSAISAAREISRKSNCESNLRNWSVALWEYESSFKYFPAGYVHPENAYATSYNGPWTTGPATALLMQFGEPTLYREMKWETFNSMRGVDIISKFASPGVFRCSSDPYVHKNSLSYVVNAGVFSHMREKARISSTVDLFGAFDFRTSLSTNSFSDGLSTTVFMSEKRVGSMYGTKGISQSGGDLRRDVAFAGFSTPSSDMPNRWINHCSAAASTPTGYYVSQGRNWVSGFDSNYNHIAPPNYEFECATDTDYVATGVRGASSYHNGSVVVMFGDGSVVSIPSSVDLITWRAIATRSSGESISREF